MVADKSSCAKTPPRTSVPVSSGVARTNLSSAYLPHDSRLRFTPPEKRHIVCINHKSLSTALRAALLAPQIIEISANDGTDVNGGDCLMRGHFRDQLWGLASHPAKVPLCLQIFNTSSIDHVPLAGQALRLIAACRAHVNSHSCLFL